MSTSENGRNPFLIVGGAILVGIALALLLFGNSLWGSGETAVSGNDAPVLDQVPALGEAEVAELPAGSRPPEVGDQAQDFYLFDLEGNPVQLGELRGRPVIINFWATWCAPCRAEMPDLQATYERHRDDGLVILAVNNQETPEMVREFFYEEFDLTFTPVLDEQGLAAELYRVFNFPTTIFVDREGTITAVHRGAMVSEQIEAYLQETLPEESG